MEIQSVFIEARCLATRIGIHSRLNNFTLEIRWAGTLSRSGWRYRFLTIGDTGLSTIGKGKDTDKKISRRTLGDFSNPKSRVKACMLEKLPREFVQFLTKLHPHNPVLEKALANTPPARRTDYPSDSFDLVLW